MGRMPTLVVAGNGGRIIVTPGRLDDDKKNLITSDMALFFVCTMKSYEMHRHRHEDMLVRRIIWSRLIMDLRCDKKIRKMGDYINVKMKYSSPRLLTFIQAR